MRGPGRTGLLLGPSEAEAMTDALTRVRAGKAPTLESVKATLKV